jgi:hypothetical protein
MPDCACGCSRPAARGQRGLSSACYQRWLYHGKPPFDQIPPPSTPHVPVAERIEDYLFIGGDRLSARAAAERLGVTRRTVVRWRAALRSVTS